MRNAYQRVGFAISTVVALAVAVGVPVATDWWNGVQYGSSDLGSMYVPDFVWWWTRGLLHGGWNPAVFAGFPAGANPQTGVLHPFGLLWAVASPSGAAMLERACTEVIASVGMVLYLRRIGRSRTGALVGGLAFGAAGFVLVRLWHPPIARTAAAMPWLLLALEARRPRLRVVGVALATALVVAGGHPQVVAYAVALGVAYVAIVLRPSMQSLGTLTAGGVLGFALSAPAWVPAFAVVAASARAGASSQGLVDPVLPLGELYRAAVPFAHGGSVGAFYGNSALVLYAEVVDRTVYPGMLALLAALAGVPTALRDRRGRFWLLIATAGLLFASIPGLARLMPGVRGSSRMIVWVSLAMAPLAACGVDALLAAHRRVPRPWMVAMAITAAMLVAAASRPAVLPHPLVASTAVFAVSAAAVLGLRRVQSHRARAAVLLLVLAADLAALGTALPLGEPHQLERIRTAVEASAEAYRSAGVRWPGRVLETPFVVTANPPAATANWFGLVGVAGVQGYDPLVPVNLVRLLDEHVSVGQEAGFVTDPTLAASASHVLDLLRCELVIARGGPLADALETAARADPDRWEVVEHVDGARAYRNRRAFPVGWLVHAVRIAPDSDARAMVRGAAGFDPAGEALSPVPIPGVEPAGASPGLVTLLAYENDEVRLAVETSAAALLVTSERAAAGWTATVDGAPAAVHTVNTAFRAVVVPGGRHEVALRYRPPGGGLATFVAAAALLALVVVAAAVRAP
jgi:hypothetical protein